MILMSTNLRNMVCILLLWNLIDTSFIGLMEILIVKLRRMS